MILMYLEGQFLLLGCYELDVSCKEFHTQRLEVSFFFLDSLIFHKIGHLLGQLDLCVICAC